MRYRRAALPLALITGVALGLGLRAALRRGPIGNLAPPEPAEPVDLKRYLGLWYEIGRYENSFERGCEAVTAEYRLGDNGLIEIVNSCRCGAVDGRPRASNGRAKVVEGSGNAKLKVSFFGPFFVGNYWVLDHGADYDWSIVGEPSGRYLWLLHRAAKPTAAARNAMLNRARELGYDTDMVRLTAQ